MRDHTFVVDLGEYIFNVKMLIIPMLEFQQGHPMDNCWKVVLKDQKQWVNTALCFIIYNKYFLSVQISVLSLSAGWSHFFIKWAYLRVWFNDMIWNCFLFCCCPPIWLAICIMKIATYLSNILKIYKVIPHVLQTLPSIWQCPQNRCFEEQLRRMRLVSVTPLYEQIPKS